MDLHAIQQARLRGRKGLTIIEVLIGLALLGVVSLTVSAVFSAAFRGLTTGRSFSEEQRSGRFLLEWMTRRLRVAGFGAPAGTVEFITQGAETAVAFRGDIAGSGWLERRFCLDTSTGVVREQKGAEVSYAACTAGAPITPMGVQPLRVVRLRFCYYYFDPGTGQEAVLGACPPAPDLTVTQRTSVARVRMELGLDSNRSTIYEAANDFTLTMDAVLRNLGN